MIPDSVTTIGYWAFEGCGGLTAVTIPDNVTYIDWAAFDRCANLRDVYYGGSEERWKEIRIGGTVTFAKAETGTDGKLASLPVPAPGGNYKFAGWYAVKTGGEEVTADTVFEVDATVYARWISANFILGDVNGDGEFTLADLLRLAKHFSGYEVVIDEAASDVITDGKLTRADLLRLAKYFLGYDVKLGK